jgi:hypothetical protein
LRKFGELTAETLVVRKNPFRQNEHLQVFDFVEADFAILMIFEFFLMTAENTEEENLN